MKGAHVAFLVAACALLFAGACGEPRAAGGASVRFHTTEGTPEYGSVDAGPIDQRALAVLAGATLTDDEWQRIFSVRAGDSVSVPMIGKYSVTGNSIRFTPRFPPAPGVTYVAVYDAGALQTQTGVTLVAGGARSAWKMAAVSGASTTTVTGMYPSTDSVPMNLLRVYIHFSAPMSVGDQAEERVHLVDENGNVVKDAFLVAANNAELWDRDHKRLTLLFDPGRIKRDLVPHEALGLSLREGHSYRIVVDSTWHDAHGRPLKASFEKRFKVGPVDRTLPRTSTWTFSWPRAGERAAIDIALPEPLDYPMLMRMITVKRADGSVVAGSVEEPTSEERHVAFVPAEPWKPGEYYLEVDGELEDLAGNNLKRLFDVAPGDKDAFGITTKTAKVSFRVR